MLEKTQIMYGACSHTAYDCRPLFLLMLSSNGQRAGALHEMAMSAEPQERALISSVICSVLTVQLAYSELLRRMLSGE